jgi:GT2 family glycosyltransferase
MSFRKETLENIGGFDERFTGSAINEEVDAFVRLNDAGYNAIFAPNASLFHHVAPTGGCRSDKAIVSGAQSKTKNRCLYATKTLGGLNWLRYIIQEIWTSYAIARTHNLNLGSFIKIVASSMRGILLFYTQSPNRHSKSLETGSTLTMNVGH